MLLSREGMSFHEFCFVTQLFFIFNASSFLQHLNYGVWWCNRGSIKREFHCRYWDLEVTETRYYKTKVLF